MKIRDMLIVLLICILVVGLYLFDTINLRNFDNNAFKIYNVYLNGKVIGVIDNKDKLYALIDEKQQSIKDKYQVNNVYPPKSLQVVENYSYNPTLSNINDIYNMIESEQDFTISGYEVNVSSAQEHDAFSFYILDKEILNEAIKKFVYAFIDQEDFEEYMNGTQKDLEESKINYSDLKFLEDITIREKYISVNDKIYDNSDELVQNLLFGFNYEEKGYTVKEGDTIESISENNVPPLNVQEFLIANPKFTSKDSLLTIGERVNITLINPELSLSYTVNEMKEVEESYDKKVVRDNSKPSDYYEITTPGVTGLSIQKSRYNVVNGEPSSEITIYDNKVIREKVDQVTTRGIKVQQVIPQVSPENYEGSGSGWQWPTGRPYFVTSEFAPRWGKYHNGMDISGTGLGSNIFASGDGVVVSVNRSCPNQGYYGSSCGMQLGNYVIINHGDNIYTVYGHMLSNIPVNVGDTVSKGQVIGHMGNSGSSTGIHLHFGLSIGVPFNGGTFRNPRELFR